MRKFLINVNGNPYEVEVEEVFGARPANVYAPAAPAPAPAAVPVPAPAPKAEAPAPAPEPAAGPVKNNTPASNAIGTKVPCPMPGTILDIKVNVGDSVKKSDLLLILEAMKMENEILSPCDGTVASVNVAKGDSVDSNQLLAVIG